MNLPVHLCGQAFSWWIVALFSLPEGPAQALWDLRPAPLHYNRITIDVRQVIADARRHLGDCVGDSVIGKGRRGILQKTVEVVHNALTQGLALCRDRTPVIICDNGLDFADYEYVVSDLETCIISTHSYASREPGCMKMQKACLIKQFFPGDYDQTAVTNQEIDKVMIKLNHLPRKSLASS